MEPTRWTRCTYIFERYGQAGQRDASELPRDTLSAFVMDLCG